jgi:hypothetical protein
VETLRCRVDRVRTLIVARLTVVVTTISMSSFGVSRQCMARISDCRRASMQHGNPSNSPETRWRLRSVAQILLWPSLPALAFEVVIPFFKGFKELVRTFSLWGRHF